MSSLPAGRHRAPGHHRSVARPSLSFGRGSNAVLKASGALVAAGGLAASIAMPTASAVVPDAGAAAPAAATAPAVAAAATAPAAREVGTTGAFGDLRLTVVAKPKPKPVVRVEEAASRSTDGDTGTREPIRPKKRDEPKKPYEPKKPATGGVLDIAASLSGIPYLYGGTSPSTGFDCSGFTQYVFRQAGIRLPRTAEQQRQFASKVSNPQPGDLVFFGSPAHHVGIYAGNGRMYDSPTTGKTSGLHKIWSTNVTYGRP